MPTPEPDFRIAVHEYTVGSGEAPTPPQIVSAGPTLPTNANVGDLVFLVSDGRLYRYTGCWRVARDVDPPPDPTWWEKGEAITLSQKIESIAPRFGFHVALTGGLLYKTGPRKDADFLFYEVRGSDSPADYEGLIDALQSIDFVLGEDFGFIHKATYQGKRVDLMFPERAVTESMLAHIDPSARHYFS